MPQFSFLGLLNFRAPMLPWVLCGFAYLLSNRTPVVDLLGIGAGTLYFYLAEKVPLITEQRWRVVRTPALLRWLLNPPELDAPIDGAAPPAHAPGGYAWGANAAPADQPIAAAAEAAAAARAGSPSGDVEDETVPAHWPPPAATTTVAAAGAGAAPEESGLRRRRAGDAQQEDGVANA
jgi:hypothetical protein